MYFNNLVAGSSSYDALLNASQNNWRRTPLNVLDVKVRQRRSKGGKIVSTEIQSKHIKLLFVPLDNDIICRGQVALRGCKIIWPSKNLKFDIMHKT